MTENLSTRVNHGKLNENDDSLNKIISNSDNLTSSENNLSGSDTENELRFTKARPNLNRVPNCDSDTDKENDHVKTMSPLKSDSEDSNDVQIFSVKKRSRIRKISNSDSESHSRDGSLKATSKYDLTRTKIRNKELHDKFKKLSHPKHPLKENVDKPATEESEGKDSDDSSEGSISCSKIKQKLKRKASHTLASICDPDTSDEESNVNIKLQKSKPRTTKLTSPKAVRMSAKQAMENMQKIKSESNRMLREKEVSLPYHRPKALTLKDIMNRRKPALTSDGKSLPIKMNNEQLKQYALMLEERQKEMMELCKSESDDEEEKCPEESVSPSKLKLNEECSSKETTLNEVNYGSSDANDKTFDDIMMEHSMNEDKENLDERNINELMVASETEEHSAEINCNLVDNKRNGHENKLEKPEQAMGISNLHENASPLNDLKEAAIDTTERQDENMDQEDLPKDNESHINELNKDTGKENESQMISLHYDSEKTDVTGCPEDDIIELETTDKIQDKDLENFKTTNDEQKKNISDEFSDTDFTMEELEEIIENAEVNRDTSNRPSIAALDMKPKLTGTPGMVIDLDGNSDNTQKRLTGVELLKERFTYYAKLKSAEDMEKDREKKFKPGIQHLKLKQELEEQIAEQRSLEWEKRLQAESQLKAEKNTDEVEEFDDIEKIEEKLKENDEIDEDEQESSSEEETEDTDIYDVQDKPRIRNPMIDDEAEVSEKEGVTVGDADENKQDVDDDDDDEGVNDSEDDDDDTSQSEEEEPQTKCRKGRILKAFEDSDDESSKLVPDNENSQPKSHEIPDSQDDEMQLAQPQKTFSDDLFSSQEFTQKSTNGTDVTKVGDMGDLGSFSILKPNIENISEKEDFTSEKLDVIYESQPGSDENFDAIAGMCTGAFVENLVSPPDESSQLSQSQDIGDDVVELCTGKFYDNPFVSQARGEAENKLDDSINESETEKNDESYVPEKSDTEHIKEGENKLLKSILEELDDPEFDSPKPNKYFFNATKSKAQDIMEKVENTQYKKKFVIESDEEMNDGAEVAAKKKKKLKKRKLENRALQISDDEEEYSDPEEETLESDVEEENGRLVEYDSEENEVEIHEKVVKKKRVGKDFFEQEAELTSEDEWIGSGDEDEAGLDRMEREAGDDDTFHQGKLQKELGEIHLREVLDQDKREVRMLQEMFFEDADLGDGHRQRKFRWKNADGEEELGTNADEYADTQEDEFESEEQWRKQRHEREMFLRKLQQSEEEDANVSINRSAFIKANLAPKLPSGDTAEKIANAETTSGMEINKPQESTDKKASNRIPSPKKHFIILQQNYHNSLLTRGRGALARLAALATPLVGDGDDAPKVNASSSRGNFVFAAITPTATGSKAMKRKAGTSSPMQVKKKKMESNNSTKNSLLDHL